MMKGLLQRSGLRAAGVMSYIGVPLGVSAAFWGLFSFHDAGMGLSMAAVMALIGASPVISQLLKNLKVNLSGVKLWLIIGVISGLFMLIGKQVFIISCGGLAGALGGDFMFAKATKNREAQLKAAEKAEEATTRLKEREEMAALIAAKMKAGEEVDLV